MIDNKTTKNKIAKQNMQQQHTEQQAQEQATGQQKPVAATSPAKKKPTHTYITHHTPFAWRVDSPEGKQQKEQQNTASNQQPGQKTLVFESLAPAGILTLSTSSF